MKNFRRKALPSMAMLAVASLTLGSVTYAWFTQNAQVTASDIDVNVVETQGGISIAKIANGSYTNKIAFTHTVGTEEVGDFKDYKISPLSTDGTLTNGVLSFFKGTVSNDDPTQLTRADAVNELDDAKEKGYILMNLFFENQNTKDQDVYFDYTLGNELKEMLGNSYPISTEALRIAFVNRGYQNTKPTTAEGESWTPAQTTGNATIIEPNSTKHLTQYDTDLSIKDLKQEYYGISGAISTAVDIKPSANITDQLTKVTTTDVRERNQKQAVIYYSASDTSTDLIANGFYQIGTKWYLRSSIKYTAQELYTADEIVEISGVTYLKSSVQELKYTAADVEETALDGKALRFHTDSKYYKVTDFDNEGALKENAQEVVLGTTVKGYALYDGTPTDDQNKYATVGGVKVAESGELYNRENLADQALIADKGDGFVPNQEIYDKDNAPTGAQVVKEAAHTPIFTLKGQTGGSTYNWIQCYVWLEGQDVDCLSTISNLDFSITLKFVGHPVSNS